MRAESYQGKIDASKNTGRSVDAVNVIEVTVSVALSSSASSSADSSNVWPSSDSDSPNPYARRDWSSKGLEMASDKQIQVKKRRKNEISTRKNLERSYSF